MDDILLLQFLKKKGVINERDMHEFHELASKSLYDEKPIYLEKEIVETPQTEKLTQIKARDMVSQMYHIENGRKYIGEKFDVYKAKEVCQRYRGILPNNVTYLDVYLAINSHYHNYICLFRQWFDQDADCKIIEAAMTYWFLDDDWKYEDKVSRLFKD